jgi:hypothetical protein
MLATADRFWHFWTIRLPICMSQLVPGRKLEQLEGCKIGYTVGLPPFVLEEVKNACDPPTRSRSPGPIPPSVQ